MAILDDEEEYPSSSPFAASEQRLSALEGSAYAPADYSAGEDQEEIPVTPREALYAQTAPRRATARSPRIQARVDEIERLMARRVSAAGGDEIARMRAIAADPAALEQYTAKLEPIEIEVTAPAKTEEEAGGWGEIFKRSIKRGTEDLGQSKAVAEGKTPKASETPPADYEQALMLADFGDPIMLAKKTFFGLGRSYPAVAASILGGAVGSVFGPIGTAIGAAAGMGGGAAIQELGPAYLAELEALGANPTEEQTDKAWSNALITVGKTGVVNAASMALLQAGKPLANALKGIWTKAAVEGAAAPVAGVPTRIGVQVAGQPAIGVGGEAAANVAQGKPITENLDPAAAGSIANVAADVAGLAGGRMFRRAIRGRAKPGVTEEQAAALDETQPPAGTQSELPLEGGAGARPPPAQGDLTPPARNWGGMELPEQTGGPTIRPDEAPGPAGRRYDVPPEEPIPARQPTGSAPRPVPPDIEAALAPDSVAQMRLPDVVGPGRQPLGDQVYTPRPPAPEQGELPGTVPPTAGAPVRGPQLDLGMEGGAEGPARMIGGQRIPEGAPFTDEGATSIGAAARPIGRVGPEPAVIPTRETDLAAQPDLLRTPEGQVRGPQGQLPMQEYEVGGVRVSENAPVLETARRAERQIGAERPIGRVGEEEAAPPPGRPTQAEGQQELLNMKTAEGWTLERDHTGPGVVVKNEAGNVISVGDTQAQALEFARARHPDQVEATTGMDAGKAEMAKPATPGTKRQPAPRDVTPVGEAREEAVVRRELAEARKTPPAGGAEPAAKAGGDAVPEPPVKQTPAEVVKAKGETKQAAKKAVSEEKAAEVKAKGEARVKPPQGERDVTQEVREGILTDAEDATRVRALDEFEQYLGRTLENRKVSETARNSDRARQLDAWEQGFDAGLRDQTTPASVKGNVITSFRMGRMTGRLIRGGRVTKTDESSASSTQKPAPKTGVGTITKTGAFTMGEGEPPPARRAQPKTSTETEMSRDARAEMEDQPLVVRVAGEAETARGMPEPREFSLPEGESKVRHAWRLVTGLVKGDVDLATAIKMYGEKLPGTHGRPRTFSDLTKVVREALRQAEDPAIEDGLRAKMATMKADTKAYGDLDARVDMLEAARLNKEVLAATLKELEAIDRGTKPTGMASRRAFSDTLDSMKNVAARRLRGYVTRRPEINKPLEDILNRPESSGLHAYLDAIINNPAAQRLTPEYVELAKVLRRMLPDLEVRRESGASRRELGVYFPDEDYIALNPDAVRKYGASMVTVLHEGIHGATVHYIDHLFFADNVHLSPRELAHKSALLAIEKEIGRLYNERGVLSFGREAFNIEYALERYEGGTPHEIITQALTNPYAISALASARASGEFRSSLNSIGMGVPKSASIWDGFKRVLRSIFRLGEKHESVLDLILRPATEITEVGARFRQNAEAVRRVNEHRETLRNNADVIDSGMASRDGLSLKRIKNALINVTEPGWRLALKGAMHGATMNAIHDAIKTYVPAVTAHRDALEAVARATYDERVRPITTYAADGRAITEPHVDKTKRLFDEMQRGGAASKDMQALATDVQYAEASMLNPADNAHVDPTVLRGLQDRWNNLTPAMKQTYKESVELYNDRERVAREARVRQFSEGAFPGFTRAQHDDIVQHMSTRAGIEDIVANTDRSVLAQRMGPRWANSKELVTLMAETERDHGFTRGDHFPLNRHGEYVVSAGDASDKPNYVVRMFEQPAQARDFQTQLAKIRNDVSQVFVKTKENFMGNMGVDRALGTFDAAMARAGLGDTQKKILRDIYAGSLLQQGMRTATHTMRRERILGASEDQARNMLNDFMAHSTRVGHSQHQGEVIRTWFQADKEAREYRRTPGASVGTTAMIQDGVEELRRRMTPADGDNSADGMGRGTRGLTTLVVLDTLIRPAHLAFQIAGNHIAATSLIGGKHGIIQSHLAVNKAIAQLTGTAFGIAGRGAMAAYRRELKAAHWNVSELYRERLKRAGYDHNQVDAFIDSMNRSNLIEQTKIREMQRMAGPNGWADIPVVGRALDMFSAGEHAIDSAMRVASGWAALQLELKKNPGRFDDALEYGKQIARDAQPDWNFYNKSAAATRQGKLGVLAPIITQYKQFGLHMYGVQGNLILNSVRDPASRKEALRSLALLQGQHAMLYGGIGASIFGSLPMMVGMGMYDLLSGDDRPHTNQEAQMRARNWVFDMTQSKTMADMFDRGVPMAFGADIHRSLSFVNLLGVPELKSFDKEGLLNFTVQAMTGASGDTAAGLTDAALKIVKGDWRKENFLKLAPRAIEDPLTSALWSSEGLKDARGAKTILRPQDFSTRDLILKAGGVIPGVVSDARQARTTTDLQQKVVQDAHDHILKRLVLAKPNERKPVLDEIRRYNLTMPPNDRITGQQIQRRFSDQAMAKARPELYGMNVPRADIRATRELTRSLQP